MDIEQFHSERVALQGRVKQLVETETSAPQRAEVSLQLIAEIGSALEELRVAEEDLREFNEELILAREQCEAERLRYQELFDSCPDGYVVTTPEGVITEANVAASEMFSMSQELLKGRPLLPFIAQDHRRQAVERLRAIATGDRATGWELEFQVRSGKSFVGSVTAGPIQNAHGSPEGVRWMIRDITRQREAAAIVDSMRERLRRSEQLSAIGILAAGLGHDVKNLLFPIRSRLDALSAANLPEQATEDVEAVRHSVGYLQQLAVNLQMLAERPETLKGPPVTTHLPAWWEHVQPLLTSTAPRCVTISIRLDPDVPPLAVPPHLLTQAAFNLVTNALKAVGPEGHITIWAEGNEQSPEVRFGVSDNGPGLRSDELEQLQTAGARLKPGLSTGLGLPLVRGIVEAAGGSMAIHSEPGAGTTVVLRIPSAPSEDAAKSEASGGPYAVISLTDRRLSSSTSTLLQLWRLPAKRDLEADTNDEQCVLWVAEPSSLSPREALEFLSRGDRRLVLVGSQRGHKSWASVPAVWIEPPATPRVLRDALSEVVHEVLRST